MENNLTIIIPHRNSISKLRRILTSIKNEEGLQIIIIDDRSDKGQEANQLEAEFPHFVFKNNRGPEFNAGSARNHGLQYVEGDWVFFADADDYFVSGGLDTILSSVRDACPKTDIIFFNLTSIKEITGGDSNRHVLYSGLLDQWFINGDETGLRYRWTVPFGKAIRHDLIKGQKIEFDSLEASNDVIFSQLCGHMARKVLGKPDIVYCISESDNSLTATLTPERAVCRLDALTRRNVNLLKWGTNIRLDWGFTYFLRSHPWAINSDKKRIYKCYLKFLLRRGLRLKHGIASR